MYKILRNIKGYMDEREVEKLGISDTVFKKYASKFFPFK